jgi:hypothetical protein
MLIEHSFISTREAPETMGDLALLLQKMGFKVDPSAMPAVLDAKRGRKHARSGARISTQPQRVHLSFDRGRVSLAAHVEVRGKEYPEYETLLVSITEILNRRIDGSATEAQLLDGWAHAIKQVDRRGRVMRGVSVGCLTTILVGFVALIVSAAAGAFGR